MIDNEGIDTIVLGGSAKDDTITLTGWDSPLSTSLSTDYSYSATLGTPTSITSGGTGATAGGGGGSLSTTITNNGLLWGGAVTSASPSVYTNQTTGWTTYNNQPSIMKVECDAEFKGEVTIRGVKLDERLNAIEERLGILRPNNDLEGKWEKLKALGEEYRKLEQEILEGESIWATLKK
jgi:hypothetical protein